MNICRSLRLFPEHCLRASSLLLNSASSASPAICLVPIPARFVAPPLRSSLPPFVRAFSSARGRDGDNGLIAGAEEEEDVELQADDEEGRRMEKALVAEEAEEKVPEFENAAEAARWTAAQRRKREEAAKAQEKPRETYEYGTESLKELKFDVWPYYVERAWWKEGKMGRTNFWAEWGQLRDIKIRRTVAEWGPDRMRYKAMKTNNILPRAIIDEFQERMDTMPKRAHPNLIIMRCQFTGRRRGKFNKYRVNRHIFRQLADRGHLSGYQRACW